MGAISDFTVTPQFNLAEQPETLVGHALSWLQQGDKVALVTLVNIEGNAPYPVGSQMLVNQHGAFVGQITGGCAETAIADQAVQAIAADKNQIQRYGLDSPFFDIQLPCGSGIDVYFDCQQSLEELQEIQARLNDRQAVERSIERISKIYRPTPRMILLGQGPILCHLAKLGLQSGFDVLCIAQNQDTQNLLADNNLCFLELEKTPPLTDLCDEYTAVASLFHEHDLETPILREALDTPAFFIGALGSKRTQAARLESLLKADVPESLLSRIHGPVGLDIGANTPAQIAVSILAEVIKELNDSTDS